MDAVSKETSELAAMKAELEKKQARIKELQATIGASAETVAPSAAGHSGPTGEFKYSTSSCPGRMLISSIISQPDGGASLAGQTVAVAGWVKTGRENGNNTFAFLEINDGSSFANMQVLLPKEVHELKPLCQTGTSVAVTGVLVALEGRKQAVELKATEVTYVGGCDGKTYPLHKGKTRITMEKLRTMAHLRPRTNTFGAVLRVRNSLAFATHKFFNDSGFYYLHTPLITASDCEGAGEMFQVTTLLSKSEAKDEKSGKAEGVLGGDSIGAPLEAINEAKANLAKAQARADEAEAAGKKKKQMKSELKGLATRKAQLAELEAKPSFAAGLPVDAERKIKYEDDFFGSPTFLTVSGQLQAEIGACALSNVYTFGPTFRAEYSFTSRHLAEFWMIEPELVFANLEDDMRLAEDYVRFCCQYLLDNNLADMEFFSDEKYGVDKEALSRLRMVASTDFERCPYTKAIGILKEALAAGIVFDPEDPEKQKIEWGMDMASEHERYLCEKVFNKPTIVYNYPKDIKAFYMRLNDPGTDGAPGLTVAAMDILVPGVGELIGGSVREERLEVLEERIKETGMPLAPYWWYLDLRKYGTVPHAGFGLGFERLVLFTTGMSNIRDVIPFPRFPGANVEI